MSTSFHICNSLADMDFPTLEISGKNMTTVILVYLGTIAFQIEMVKIRYSASKSHSETELVIVKEV